MSATKDTIQLPNNVLNYHNLPCLIVDNQAVIFSYVNNRFVTVKVPIELLNNADLYEKVKQNGFFEWVKGGNVEHEDKQLTLSLTEKCNCACKYCFLDANTEGDIMSVETLHHAIDYAFKYYEGHKVIVCAFGGEPSTQSQLVEEMVNYSNFVKNKYSVSPQFAITTNCVMPESFVNFLIKHNFDCSVSIDGIEEVQNRQRPLANGNDSYDIAINNLKKLAHAGVFLRVRSTVTKYSVSKMVDAVDLFGGLGVQQIHFEPVTKAGRGANLPDEMLPPTVDAYVEQLKLCIERAKQYGSHINFSIFSHCNGSIQNKMIIGASGMISACVEVQTEKHQLSKQFGMGKISGEQVKLINRTIGESMPSMDPAPQNKCNECPYKLFCSNSCPVRNFRATGNIWHTEPFKCELYHKIMPFVLNEFYKSTYNF